jgi:hypothetical protein
MEGSRAALAGFSLGLSFSLERGRSNLLLLVLLDVMVELKKEGY